MKRKKYLSPTVKVVTLTIEAHLLAGSQDPWADSKDNTGGWEDDEDYGAAEPVWGLQEYEDVY